MIPNVFVWNNPIPYLIYPFTILEYTSQCRSLGGRDCPSEYIFPQYIGKANGKGLTSDQPMRHFQCLNWEISGIQMFLFLYTWKNKLIKRYVVDFEWNIWLFGWYENYLYSLATEVQISPLFWQISTNVDEDEIVNPSHWHCMTINLPSDKEGVVSGWNF